MKTMDFEPAYGSEVLSLDRLAERIHQGQEGLWQTPEWGEVTVAGPASRHTLLLAHGAGAGHDSAFLTAWRGALAGQGIQTLSLEFCWLRRMRREGRRRPPPPIDVLCEEYRQWRDLLSPVVPGRLWLGGKSMGGRVASMVAAAGTHRERSAVAGLVLAGYPFHPVGKAQRLRLDHWPRLACPVLVLQGERDPFGNREEVPGYGLGEQASVMWLKDGDHDWSPRRASGVSHAQLIDEAAQAVRSFIDQY